MDQLIALVLLRWRTELRAFARARERLLGLLLVLPVLALGALLACVFVYVGLRSLDRMHPELTLPAVSLAATGIGLFWSLSPLLAGLALSETHDVTRLMHFPIPLRTLALSSLAANLLQPTVLLKLPVLIAVAAALTRRPSAFPFALAGVLLTFAFILAASQVIGLVLQGVSRNRRLQDAALFLGLGFGFLISLVPLFVIAGGRGVATLGRWLLGSPVVALSPFAWGARAAVHAGRGAVGPFVLEAGLALAAIVGAMALSGSLIQRIHSGALDLGPGSSRTAGGRMRFSGPLGALLEKDARVAWRDPAIKASLVMGLIGPLLFLFLLVRSRESGASAWMFLFMAWFVGLSGLGANAFGLERRGVLLLLSFPTPRWRLLLAKNLGTLLLRVPGFLMLLLGGLILAPAAFLLPAAAIALATFLIASGLDNYMSIRYPAPVAPPGRSAHGGGAAGGRGLAGAVLGLFLMGATFVLSFPFVFLVLFPVLFHDLRFWAVTVPLALAGAAAVYAMMVAGAAKTLLRREPELLERILVEE